MPCSPRRLRAVPQAQLFGLRSSVQTAARFGAFVPTRIEKGPPSPAGPVDRSNEGSGLLLGLAFFLGLARGGLLLSLGRLGRGRNDLEARRIVLDPDLDLAAIGELAEQQLLGERLLDLLLDQTAHRSRTVELVVAAIGQPFAGVVVEL